MEINNVIETTEAKRLTILEKLKYFFTNPNKIFEEYNVKPTWLVKLLIIITLTVIATMITKALTAGPQIDILIQKSPDITKEQAESMVQLMNSPIMTGFTVGIAILSVAFAVFIVPLIYWGLISLFGGKTSYMRIVSVYSLAYIPYSLGALITLSFSYYTNNYEGLLQPQMMDVFLDRMGLFVIWQALLLIFGFSKIADLKLQKSAIIVAIMWILATGFSLVPVLMNRML